MVETQKPTEAPVETRKPTEAPVETQEPTEAPVETEKRSEAPYTSKSKSSGKPPTIASREPGGASTTEKPILNKITEKSVSTADFKSDQSKYCATN